MKKLLIILLFTSFTLHSTDIQETVIEYSDAEELYQEYSSTSINQAPFIENKRPSALKRATYRMKSCWEDFTENYPRGSEYVKAGAGLSIVCGTFFLIVTLIQT